MTHRSIGAALLSLSLAVAACAPERVGDDSTPSPEPTGGAEPMITQSPESEATKGAAPTEDGSTDYGY